VHLDAAAGLVCGGVFCEIMKMFGSEAVSQPVQSCTETTDKDMFITALGATVTRTARFGVQ
jgi:hypothetical protein